MFIYAEITTQDVAWRQIFSVLTVLKRIQINSLAQRKITSRLMTASLNKSELIYGCLPICPCCKGHLHSFIQSQRFGSVHMNAVFLNVVIGRINNHKMAQTICTPVIE
mmetsp:Transcript_3715/g.5038  ORF Transcript_3715/g.5038 Transcript_3715/m.5038 type:complete len:108 (-) Transcript_3715:1535-1858(-)